MKLVWSLGMETSVPQALFWMQLRTQSGGCQLESPWLEEALARGGHPWPLPQETGSPSQAGSKGRA